MNLKPLLSCALLVAPLLSFAQSAAPSRAALRFNRAQGLFEQAKSDFDRGSKIENLALFRAEGHDLWECTDTTALGTDAAPYYAVGKIVLESSVSRTGALYTWSTQAAFIHPTWSDVSWSNGLSRSDTFAVSSRYGLSSHFYQHDFEVPLITGPWGPGAGLGYVANRRNRTQIIRMSADNFAEILIRTHYYGSEQRDGGNHIEILRCRPLLSDI
jgi:hypothetical protein